MEKKFDETQMPQIICNELSENTQFTLGAMHVGKMNKVIMAGTSILASKIKSTDKPKAIAFRKESGEFVAGARIEFLPNPEDPENPASGNWSYTWTFYESDLDGADVINVDTSIQTLIGFNKVAFKEYRMTFNDNAGELFAFVLILDTISAYLEENAKEGDPLVLHCGAFDAKVKVEDGVVKKTIEPNPEYKVMAKGDDEYQDAIE